MFLDRMAEEKGTRKIYGATGIRKGIHMISEMLEK